MIWECLDQDCQDPLGPHMLVMFNRSQPWFEPQKRKQTRLGRTCSCFKLDWFQILWWFEGKDRSMVIRGFHSTLKSGWFCLPHSAIDGLHLGSVSGRMRQGCLGFAWTEKCQWRLFDPVVIFWASLHVISRPIASSSGLVLAQLCQSTNRADVFLSHPSAENNFGLNKPK